MKIILLSFVLLVSCLKNEDVANKLTTSLSSEVPTFDPAVSFDAVSYEILGQVYESLYEYDFTKRPYELKPLLAESLPEISKDKKTYTIKIKQGIKYHENEIFPDTRTLKALDFVNQIKRVIYPRTKSNGVWLFEGQLLGYKEFVDNCRHEEIDCLFNTEVAGLKAIDDHTLQIKLTRAHPQFIYGLTLPFTTPIPEEIIRHTDNDLTQVTIGTGPFKLKDWKKGLNVKLVKNHNYTSSTFNGDKLPYLDEIEFLIMREAQTRWLNFLSKKLDFLELSQDQLAVAIDNNGKIKNEITDKGIEYLISPTLTFWWLSFNMNDPIVGKNKYLRHAIAHAIDFDKFIKTYTNGTGVKATSIYPQEIEGHNPNSTKFKYDPELAKKYLEQAGHPNGDNLPLIQYDVRGNDTSHRQMGEFIRAELGKIGIKIQVNTNTFPYFLQKRDKGELQFWQDGWILDYPDPENVLQLLISKNFNPGPNTTNYEHEFIDKFYDQLPFLSHKERLEGYKKVEDIVQDDLPWIMEYYSRNYLLYHNGLENIIKSDLIYSRYKYIKKALNN